MKYQASSYNQSCTGNYSYIAVMRNIRYVWAGILFLLSFSSLCTAKPLLQFHNLDKSDGLASSVVYDIAEDSNGFIWFATQDGLQKYDGVELVDFRFNPSVSNSLSNNIVRNLLFASDGLLWVGTEAGIDLYDPNTETFQKLSDIFPKEQKLLSNQIRAIHQTLDGVVWIGSAAGLSSVNLKNRSITNYPLAKVRSVFEDDFNRLWVGTLGDGLYLFDRVTKKFKLVDRFKETSQNEIIKSGTKSPVKESSGKESIVDIFQDSFGRLLIATWGSGVLRLNPETLTLTPFLDELPSPFVRTIQQDEIGQLWIGTNKGILIRDTIERKSQKIFSDHSNIISPRNDNITKIFQGEDNTIWLGTFGGGVAKHLPKSRQFETYGANAQIGFARNDAVVASLYENNEGSVWIGTESAKLYKFKPESHTIENYPLLVNSMFLSDPILAIYQNSLGMILLGTSTGVYQFKILDNNNLSYQKKFFHQIKDSVSFIKEGKDKKLYIGYINAGVFAYENDSLGEYVKSQLNISKIKNPQAFLSIDKTKILIGSRQGVYEIKISDENVDINLMSNTLDLNVLDLAMDWGNNLWVGTWSKGIQVFKENELIEYFDEFSGIPNNTVYSIIIDRNSNRVWASSNEGLFSIDLTTKNIDTFAFSDGLQANEFNSPGLQTGQGYIYFGGINGFNRFYPKIIQDVMVVSPVKIIDFRKTKVGEKNISSDSTESLYKKINKILEVNYNQTPFSFSFSSPQFGNPNYLEYRYRLKGLNDNWTITTSDSRRAVFNHVPPGTYQFEVQVRGKNDAWNDLKASHKIVIYPPLWLSTQAKFVYVLFGLLILSLVIFRLRRRQIKDNYAQKALSESEKRLRLSLWGGGNEIWDWNLVTGKILRSSENKGEAQDKQKLSITLNEMKDYVHPYDLRNVKDSLELHLKGITPYFEMSYRIINKDNDYRWVRDRGKIVERNSKNEPLRMSGTQIDISELHKKDEEIERLGQAFKSTSDGVWIRNKDLELIDCNPAFERITGFTKNEKENEVLWFPENQEQPPRIKAIIEDSLKSKGSWQGEVWAERKNADPFPKKLSIDTILDENGHILYYVGVFTDITYRKKTEAELRRLANFDTLTGLPNRACLFDRLSQTLDKARIRNEKFAVFKIDIDNFKRFNDSFGQNTGNDLIVQIAIRLTNCIGGADTVARVGGDEFVVIQDDIDSFSEVASSADRILKELNLPIFIHGQELALNFSMGITISPDDGLSADKLLRNADTAMYEAKKEVLNSSRFYSTDLNQKAKNKLSMENALRKAIENHDIELFYQPKVDLRSGKVCGMEALARWHLAGYGNVSPDEFIKLAEETRLILPLGEYLLKKTVKQTKVWVDEGKMRGRMCFNLSAHQFWNRDLCEEIISILDFYGLESKYLEFEITESACMQNVDQTISQMEKLRDLGFQMALDDFGTGYSSLAQLKTLPLDTLKVDKSFISNIAKSKKDANLVKAIIDIAKNLSLDVVIEGVETQKQCECLWQSRANVIQGYYFSQPVDNERMGRLLSKTWERSIYLTSIDLNVTPLI